MKPKVEPGQRIGEYVLTELLRTGAMSEVFKAEHRSMKRLVVIKAAKSDNPELVKRFLREVELSGRLAHPNILPAYDAGETGGIPFLVYRWIEGMDLGGLTRREGPLVPERALKYLLQAASGLQHAHEHGIVHRDVKPANLLLDKEETILVTDFGLARFAEGLETFDPSLVGGQADRKPANVKLELGHTDSDGFPTTQWEPLDDLVPATELVDASLTHAGRFLGTPHYMAPEQTHTACVDRRADVYSLGCTLFACLEGRPLYERPTVSEVIDAHRFGAIPSLSEYRYRGFATIDPIFQRMVAKNPLDRFQSMGEMIESLERLMQENRSKARVFISYRRDDSIDAADRLYAELSDHFGQEWMMMDVDSIPSGADYRKYIEDAIQDCEVVLAVIGSHWSEAVDDSGQRRLANPADFVRLELELAMSLGKHVIPVLVGRGAMPKPEDLPAELERFAYLNAAEVRPGREYKSHVKRLADQLARLLQSLPEKRNS